MKLPDLHSLKVKNQRVLVRADLDGPMEDEIGLSHLLPTLKFLLQEQAKVIIIGHRGRPGGAIRGEFSLFPVSEHLSELLGQDVKFIYDTTGVEAEEEANQVGPGSAIMLENLRFDNREENCDPEFAKRLAVLGDFYVNESFANSHREHASIVALPREFKSKNRVAAGLRFIEEVENLSRVMDNPGHPVVVILGGGKAEKAKYVDKLLDKADWVLVGGLLPRVVQSFCRDDGKICVSAAHLVPSGSDIDEASATNFAAIISQAETIVWNGPMGEYEVPEFRHGTEVVARAVAQNSNAFKIAGGGDTTAALQSLGILAKINWVSTGGGAMLEFIAEETLPGIEALKN